MPLQAGEDWGLLNDGWFILSTQSILEIRDLGKQKTAFNFCQFRLFETVNGF